VADVTPPESSPGTADDLRRWIARWAARVPQLTQISAEHWRDTAETDVSYPSSGHQTLAAVEPTSYWFNHRNDLISAVVARFRPEEPVFDVGGGNGFVGVGLRAIGVSSVVVEPGAQGVAASLGRGLPAIEAAFHRLDVPADSLPAVGLFDVLEHIEDDAAALASLYDSIKPGGMLYIAVPARQALWSAEDVFAGHYRRYSLRRLRSVVASAGFTVLFGTYFFGLLTAPVFLMRSVPSRFGAKSMMNDPAVVERQHTMPRGVLGRIFRASFSRELARISRGEPIRGGTSCLVVARKPLDAT